jgi:O-antigen/teichoic acid export membrane protein
MNKLIHRIKEKWGEAGFQKYFRNTGWMFGARVLTLLINLFVSIQIAKQLGPEQYGTFSFIISFVSIAGFTLFAIDSLAMKKLHEDKEDSEKILGSSLIIKLVNSLFTITTATLAGLILANTSTTILMIFIYSTFTLFQSFAVVDFYFKINAKNKAVSVLGIIIVVLSSIIKIGILYYNLPLIYLLSSYVFDHFMGAVGYIYLYKKYIGNMSDIKFEKNIIKDLIIKSWPFTVSALAVTIYLKIDQVFIKVLLGSESLGLYAVAVRFSEVWFIISEVICISLLPAILNAEKTDEKLFLSRSKKLYSLLFYSSIAICIIMYFISPILINTLYGESYGQSIEILRLYIWSIVGFFIATALNQFLFAKGKFKTILSINLIGMCLSVALNYILIPILGIKGAIFANIIAYTLPFIIILSLKNMREQRVAFIKAVVNPFS